MIVQLAYAASRWAVRSAWPAAFLLIASWFAFALPAQAQETVEITNEGLIGWYVDLALDSSAAPTLVYYDNSNNRLMQATCTNSTCSAVNTSVLDEISIDPGRSISLALDSSAVPQVAYRDNAAGNLLFTQAGSANDVIAGRGGDAGWHVDTVYDEANDLLYAVYRDDNPRNSGDPDLLEDADYRINFIRCDLSAPLPNCIDPVAIITALQPGITGPSGGFPSLVLTGPNNYPSILYSDNRSTKRLELVHCDDAVCSTATSGRTFVLAENSYFNALIVDDTGDTVYGFTYQPTQFRATSQLRIISCPISLTRTCTSTTNDTRLGTYLFPDAAWDSLADLPVIAYYNFDQDRAELLRCPTVACDTGTPTIIDAPQDNTYWTTLALDPNAGAAYVAFANYALGDNLYLWSEAFPGDQPPFVTRTTPQDGFFDNSAPTQSISVDFNEEVSAMAGWLSLDCDVLGVVNGLGAAFTGTSTTATGFTVAASDRCTATIDSTRIADTDSSADNMTRNYVFEFRTQDSLAPDLDLAASSPFDGQTNVPQHLAITLEFTEPVNLPIDSVGLSCQTGGGGGGGASSQPFALTGLPVTNKTTVELFPIDRLSDGQDCTLTIDTAVALDTGTALSSTWPALDQLLGIPGDPYFSALGEQMASEAQGSLDATQNFASTPITLQFTTSSNVNRCHVYNPRTRELFQSDGHAAIQAAIDATDTLNGDTLKIANDTLGNGCNGSASYGGDSTRELALLNKSLTLEGGYQAALTDGLNLANPAAWSNPDPTRPATLDALGLTNEARVFYSNTTEIVTLRNLTLRAGVIGSSSSGRGGCLYYENGSLTLENVTVQNCRNENQPVVSGGAIFTSNANLSINASEINSNALSGSTVTSMTVRAQGSAIKAVDGNVRINDTSFASNNTNASGSSSAFATGALDVQGANTVEIAQSTFTQNQATATSGSTDSSLGAGAIVQGPAELTISDTTFSSNTNSAASVAWGAGLYVLDSNNDGITHVLERNTFNGNINVAGSSIGGGAYIESSQDIEIRNSTFSQNSSSTYGAGLYSEIDTGSSLTLNYVTFYNNLMAGSGAIFNAGGDNQVNGTIFADTSGTVDFCEIVSSGTFSGADNFLSSSDPDCPGVATVNSNVALLLGILVNNGGVTQTHALQSGNPALDGLSSCISGISTDQRGFTRPVDGDGDSTPSCDAGAFEDQDTDPNIVSIITTAFDATPDHMPQGETTLTVTLQVAEDGAGLDGAQNVGALTVYYSADAVCDASDTVIAQQPVAFSGSSTTLTLAVSIPRDLLRQQALSADVGYLCAASGNGLDAASSIDAISNKLISADDITYFPWDANSDGTLDRAEVNGAVSAVNTASAQFDTDGNGVVTPSEAAEALLRIGTTLNRAVIEQ